MPFLHELSQQTEFFDTLKAVIQSAKFPVVLIINTDASIYSAKLVPSFATMGSSVKMIK